MFVILEKGFVFMEGIAETMYHKSSPEELGMESMQWYFSVGQNGRAFSSKMRQVYLSSTFSNKNNKGGCSVETVKC